MGGRAASRADRCPQPLRYPERLGRCPAALGLFAFVALELVVDDGNLPRNVAIGTVVYSAATWVGMALYGIDRWLDRGEAFSVYFNLFARIVAARAPRRRARRPQAAVGADRASSRCRARSLFVAVMIGSVTLRRLQGGPDLHRAGPRTLSDFWNSLGFDPNALARAGATWSGCVGCDRRRLRLLRSSAIAGRASVGGGFGASELARAFVHSLVPIAFVYVAAHYMTQLLFQGQAMAYLASDPLGRGWDLFGGARLGYRLRRDRRDRDLVLAGRLRGRRATSPRLVLAHDRALVLYKDAEQAVRSQYWMLGVMVGFTSLALWLLSQANA